MTERFLNLLLTVFKDPILIYYILLRIRKEDVDVAQGVSPTCTMHASSVWAKPTQRPRCMGLTVPSVSR